MTIFRKIVFQNALYVRETHNFVNGSFEYQIKRIISIQYFGARIPPPYVYTSCIICCNNVLTYTFFIKKALKIDCYLAKGIEINYYMINVTTQFQQNNYIIGIVTAA